MVAPLAATAIGGGSGKTSLDLQSSVDMTQRNQSALDVSSGNLYYKSSSGNDGFFKYAVLIAAAVGFVVWAKKRGK